MSVLERIDAPLGSAPTVYETSERDRRDVAHARHAASAWLDAHDMPENARGDALLVVSELVTNALQCTFGRVQLGMVDTGRAVRVEVFDESPRLPTVVDAADGDTSGRGLAIVDAVSTRWGAGHHARDGRFGKLVWATLARRS